MGAVHRTGFPENQPFADTLVDIHSLILLGRRCFHSTPRLGYKRLGRFGGWYFGWCASTTTTF
jgi:hypothetical protein